MNGEFPDVKATAELEFSLAFQLEQRLVIEGASDAEIFIARNDRLAKEEVLSAMFSSSTEVVPIVNQQINTTGVLPIKTEPIITDVNKDVIATDQPADIVNDTEIEVDPNTTGPFHRTYYAALNASKKISGIVEKEELHDLHGLPLGSLSQIVVYEYEPIIGEILNGDRAIEDLRKPYTYLERAKARQALSSIAGDTDNDLKTDEWIEKFFELQASLMS